MSEEIPLYPIPTHKTYRCYKCQMVFSDSKAGSIVGANPSDARCPVCAEKEFGPITSCAPKEEINHPSHYGGDTVYETIKVIEAWGLGFCLGNAVKYISRAGKKDAEATIKDLRKAAFYLEREISNLEKMK